MFGWTVKKTLAEIDSAELSEWLAFDQLYGLPDAYMTAGLVCTVVARAMAGAKVSPEDFIPFFRGERPPQTADQMRAVMGAFAAAQNARA